MKTVFTKPITINHYGDDKVAIWTQYGYLEMPPKQAKRFLSRLIDDGVVVKAYWRDSTPRERCLDPRIQIGERI